MTSHVLGIGTAQFGMAYGVADHDMRPSAPEVQDIVSEALAHGVGFFDTAPAYGESEGILGRALLPDQVIRIVTKTPDIQNDQDIKSELSSSLVTSHDRLGRRKPDTVLIHNPSDALGPRGDRLIAALADLRAEGRINRIGVSLYNAGEIEDFRHFDVIDCLQIPMNILDQRLTSGGALAQLRDQNVEIMIRSAFLQGLLLMAPAEIPRYFADAMPAIDALHSAAQTHGVSTLHCCLSFLRAQDGIDSLVVGIKGTDQLREILRSWESDPIDLDWPEYCCDSEAMLDPRLWPAH